MIGRDSCVRQRRAAIHRKLQLRFGGAFCVPSMIGSVEVEVLYPAARSRVGTITELAKLYREARRGEIAPFQATRLASILTGLRSALEAGELSAASLRLNCSLPLVSAQD